MSIDRWCPSSLVADPDIGKGGSLAPRPEVGSLLSGDAVSDLVSQASSLLARDAAGMPSIPPGVPAGFSEAGPFGRLPQSIGPGVDPDRLRRQAHEMLETLLEVFSPKVKACGERIPLIRCDAPVAAGRDGCATVRVANDEATASEVTLYCTNLAGESGFDIPSLRVTVSPRKVTIPPNAEGTFEIKISVPQQTPAGIYSGLIQATGAQYVKAVVSVQVT
jgi:hypothetical protein